MFFRKTYISVRRSYSILHRAEQKSYIMRIFFTMHII